MNCTNPDCKAENIEGSNFCSKCGTPLPQKSTTNKSGIRIGDVGNLEGNITDASQHGAASVGSIHIHVGKQDTAQQKSDRKEAQTLFTCRICGQRNKIDETFRCVSCGVDYLCLDHLDKLYNLCQTCANKKWEKNHNEQGKPFESEDKELWSMAKIQIEMANAKHDRQKERIRLGKKESTANGVKENQSQISCQKCSQKIEVDWIVCPNCGTSLKREQCSKCNLPLLSSWKACPGCGKSVT